MSFLTAYSRNNNKYKIVELAVEAPQEQASLQE